MRNKATKYSLYAGLLFSLVTTASATTLVTFRVDMSTAPFDPNSQTVSAAGTFNGWGHFQLTNNPAGPDPTLWSGTTNLPLNDVVVSYKYTIDSGTTWETVRAGGSHNRLITLPATSGASITLPRVFFNDAPPADVTIPVTFRVDLAQQINTGAFDKNTSLAFARGAFNSWAADLTSQTTNDTSLLRTNQNGLVTSNVYVVTYDVSGAPGQTINYKYFIDTGSNWESPAPGTGDPSDANNNRFFNLSEASAQTLPIVFFNDSPYSPLATNDITLQVDMSSQVLMGLFDPGSGTVEVRGDFTSWGTSPIACTNDPAGPNPNLYKGVARISDGVGALRQFKFWANVSANGGWETMANNRTLKIVSGISQTLVPVYFNDVYVNPGDFLPADTIVTFSVSMTNAVGTDSTVFNPLTDSVFLNGVPSSFLNWDTALPQLTNNPVGSRIYSIELLLPKGSPVKQTYKYGINGVDNEAAAGNNHVRYIRTVGAYSLPLDTFGTMLIEPSFEQTLAIGSVTGGHLPVSWLGRPGVHLQTATSLTSGTWTDLLNTDGATWSSGHSSTNGFVSVTNHPTSGTQTYFRLVKP